MALACALPGVSGAQNLASNGGFDLGLTGWRVTGEGTASASPDDVAGDPASGSALLSNALPDAGTRTHPIDQCVALPGAGEYEVTGSARVDPAQPPGRATVAVLRYAGPDCTGSLIGGAGQFVTRSATWAATGFRVTMPDGGSLLLRIGVDKPGAGGTLVVQVDAVSVVRTPQVFSDGFE
jgi:hypothetical protein